MDDIRTKKLCRLCYYETTDTIGIFSPKGLSKDYQGKINKYLYLKILKNDQQPQTVCWMCSQHLETFHKFYEKINEIQRSMLGDKYDLVVIQQAGKDIEYIQHKVENVMDDDDDDDEDAGDDDDQNETVEVLVINNDEQFENADYRHEHSEYDVTETQMYNQSEAIQVKADNESIEIEAEINDATDDGHSSNQKSVTILVKTVKEEIELHEIITDEMLENAQLAEIDSNNPDITPIETEENEQLLSPDEMENKVTDRMELLESYSPLLIRKRGRPKKKSRKKQKPNDTSDEEANDDDDDEAKFKMSPTKKKTARPKLTVKSEEVEEGQSDNEFPARDSDNEDWPAQATLDEFPKKILMDGYLLVKGKRLMAMISKYYKLECDLCTDKIRFKQLKELFQHYSNVHNQEGYVICCQTKLSRYPAIIMHMARHLQPDAFKCNECGYMVTRPRFLESHKQTHLPTSLKPFKCDQCERTFCWKGALHIHQISHQKPEERKLYVCHICGKIYDTPGGLSTHKKHIHSDKKPVSNVCHVCAKEFSTRTGLNEHMATIHQPRERDQVQCNECGKWLMNQRCLKSHMILHSDTMHNCNICSYQTKKTVLLKRHFLTQHSDEKPFTCDICNKSFKLKRALTVHIAQHTSSKSYKCPFCDRQFNSSTNFYTHRKNMHPIELQRMKHEILEAQRIKRVIAGVEVDHSLIENKLIEPKSRRKIVKIDKSNI